MSDQPERRCVAFEGVRRLASGPLADVAVAVKARADAGGQEPILVYDAETGAPIDFDLRGSEAEVRARLSSARRGPGRPKLGVVAREVTLLPRHWAWLSSQRGGASVALRRLVDEARKEHDGRDRVRRAQEAAYRFMSAMVGDQPGFEEAARALFAHDRDRFEALSRAWPADVGQQTLVLAAPAWEPPAG
jgi:uncharacterized protein